MNDSYLNSGYTTTNKQHVICQEIGHNFRLLLDGRDGRACRARRVRARISDGGGALGPDYKHHDRPALRRRVEARHPHSLGARLTRRAARLFGDADFFTDGIA
jgi:hypothetical protein